MPADNIVTARVSVTINSVTVVRLSGLPGPQGAPGGNAIIQRETPTVTDGQTLIVLSGTPYVTSPVRMKVNGVQYAEGTDYIYSGGAITWYNIPFALQSTDFVEIEYQ